MIRVSGEAMYRSLSRDAYPDQGGSHDKMVELNAAVARMRELLLGK